MALAFQNGHDADRAHGRDYGDGERRMYVQIDGQYDGHVDGHGAV